MNTFHFRSNIKYYISLSHCVWLRNVDPVLMQNSLDISFKFCISFFSQTISKDWEMIINQFHIDFKTFSGLTDILRIVLFYVGFPLILSISSFFHHKIAQFIGFFLFFQEIIISWKLNSFEWFQAAHNSTVCVCVHRYLQMNARNLLKRQERAELSSTNRHQVTNETVRFCNKWYGNSTYRKRF